jgi:hypothetical protein
MAFSIWAPSQMTGFQSGPWMGYPPETSSTRLPPGSKT